LATLLAAIDMLFHALSPNRAELANIFGKASRNRHALTMIAIDQRRQTVYYFLRTSSNELLARGTNYYCRPASPRSARSTLCERTNCGTGRPLAVYICDYARGTEPRFFLLTPSTHHYLQFHISIGSGGKELPENLRVNFVYAAISAGI
jgi:hypothetical protein